MATYLSRPLLASEPDFDRLEFDQLDDFTFDSVGHGVAIPWKETDRPRRTLRIPYKFRSRQEAKEFRVFVENARGRLRGFWCPAWCGDYKAVQDVAAGAAEIEIEHVGLEDAIDDFGEQFAYFAIITKNGSGDPIIDCYHIDSVTGDGVTETITIDGTLARDLVTGTDFQMCPLLYCRLANDELAYAHDDQAIFGRVSADMVELPAEYETAHDGTRPVFLYRLTTGGTVWRFADYAADLTVTDETMATAVWSGSAIGHGDIKSGIEMLSDPVELRAGADADDHPLRRYTDPTAFDLMEVEIFLTDAGTLTVDLTAPIHKGRIQNVSFERRGEIAAEISSVFRVAEQSIPSVQNQRTCGHRLGDEWCGVNLTALQVSGTVSAISAGSSSVAPYVDATAFGAKPDQWFSLGKVTIGTEVRLCAGHVGNRLYLNAPFRLAMTGNTVTATPGCDKRINGDCLNKFDNVANALAFAYVPNKNPQFEALTTPKRAGGKKG